MAFTWRNRRLGYDNIAPGSATGQERTIKMTSAITAAGGIGDFTTKPSRDSGGNTSTSVLAIGRRENVIRIGTTDDNTAEQTTLTSATSHTQWTSGTSSVSVAYEQLGSSNIPGNVS